MSLNVRKAEASAPASIGNVIVGFDVLGFAVDQIEDRVTAFYEPLAPESLEIIDIMGCDELTREVDKNTAGIAVRAFLKDHPLRGRLQLKIQKGIPLSSGLGGSAASAVAAVFAVNDCLRKPLEKPSLLPYALAGEVYASGSLHGDNIVPSLLGGMRLCYSGEDGVLNSTQIDFPSDIDILLIHPQIPIKTKEAREILSKKISMKTHTKQLGYFGAFLKGCMVKDLSLIRSVMRDVVIEPQRAHLIPYFFEIKALARSHHALGVSLAGAGPTVFAWLEKGEDVKNLRRSVQGFFDQRGVVVDIWKSSIDCSGATLVS